AVLFQSLGGTELAVQAVRRRAGGMLDPDLVARFADNATEWLADIADIDRPSALAAEPSPPVTVPASPEGAAIFGKLAGLKAPYFLGHSRAVAELAAGAAGQLGMPSSIRADLETAGLLHDIGWVAVSNTVWDKPGRLSADEWEQVRLHPYHSERILAGSTELARLGPLVGRHHERLDGHGYHRGCGADELSMPTRILAAANAYRSLTEPR